MSHHFNGQINTSSLLRIYYSVTNTFIKFKWTFFSTTRKKIYAPTYTNRNFNMASMTSTIHTFMNPHRYNTVHIIWVIETTATICYYTNESKDFFLTRTATSGSTSIRQYFSFFQNRSANTDTLRSNFSTLWITVHPIKLSGTTIKMESNSNSYRLWQLANIPNAHSWRTLSMDSKWQNHFNAKITWRNQW